LVVAFSRVMGFEAHIAAIRRVAEDRNAALGADGSGRFNF
jgi:hypothetical protein